MTSPLIFEPRASGYTAAMLGAVEVGAIYPLDHPEAKACFRFCLPPFVLTRYVVDDATAKTNLDRIARDWLKAAGLTGG